MVSCLCTNRNADNNTLLFFLVLDAQQGAAILKLEFARLFNTEVPLPQAGSLLD